MNCALITSTRYAHQVTAACSTRDLSGRTRLGPIHRTNTPATAPRRMGLNVQWGNMGTETAGAHCLKLQCPAKSSSGCGCETNCRNNSFECCRANCTSLCVCDGKCITEYFFKKDGIFSMLRVWDKEKIWVADGNRTHDLPYTGRTL